MWFFDVSREDVSRVTDFELVYRFRLQFSLIFYGIGHIDTRSIFRSLENPILFVGFENRLKKTSPDLSFIKSGICQSRYSSSNNSSSNNGSNRRKRRRGKRMLRIFYI